MPKKIVNTPFFIFNPKSYLYGEELLEFVDVAEDLSDKKEVTIFLTAPYADLNAVSQKSKNIIVTAQHMDSLKPGQGMGHILPESLYAAGVRATFLNHAEKPMLLSDLSKAIERANELGILTIACADSIQEAKAIAMLNPDIILCEPTELIGTGQTSDDDYIEKTNKAIKDINPDILVMQAAGISTADDVFRTISLGADGTGCTSGIVKAEKPKQMLIDMVEAAERAVND